MRDCSGSSQYLEAATLVLAGDCAVYGFFEPDSLTPGGAGVIGLVVKGQWGADADGDVRLIVQAGEVRAAVQTSAGTFTAGWAVGNFTLGQRVHLLGVYSETAGSLKLYVDGIERASTAVTGTLSDNAHTVALGAYPSNLANTAFDGRLGECGFLAGGVSADDAAALAAGISPACFPALAYWPCFGVDGPEPELVAGNDATVTGATAADHPDVMSYPPGLLGLPRVFVPTFTQALGDTLAPSENLVSDHSSATPQAVGDTLAPTEALRRAILATRPETLGLTEQQALLLNPYDFDRILRVSVPLNGREFEFLRTLHVVQPAPAEFTRTLTVRAPLADFDRRLRVVPDIQTPFADDVQRPVGKVTTQA